MPTRPTSDVTTELRRYSDPSRLVEPEHAASVVSQTAGPISLAADESFEDWPSERTILAAARDQDAGVNSLAADESSDEIWVSERTDPASRPALATEDDLVSDFVSEAAAASAVVAVAVPVTAATGATGQRRLTSMVRALAHVGAFIVGSLVFVALIWPANPADVPSFDQTAPPWRISNPTQLASSVSVTGEASAPAPSPYPGTLAQASAKPATRAAPSTNVDTASVSTRNDGQLRVTSEPSGARVTVNGIGWGQTPLTIEHLSPGMKTVRVTREGCPSQERRVEIQGSRPAATLHVTLNSEGACL